jgi:hypothetical protein
MSRCSICDYHAEDGSFLLDKAPSKRTQVRWNDKHKDFLCTTCSKEIHNAVSDYTYNDYYKGDISQRQFVTDMKHIKEI